MRQILLAVQTPRAGKWNHRWIVPDGYQTDDVALKGALSKFDALNSGSIHKDGIVFYRSVEQPSSGRSGREFIFLHFPDFRDVVSSHGKTQCFNAMNAFFESRMDQLINSIDWDNTDGAMIYHSPELAALFNDIEQAIQQNQEQTKSANERGDNKRSGCAGCFRFFVALIVILAAAFYFCHGKILEWYNQHSEQIQKVLDDAVNNNANQNANKPSSDNLNILPGELSDKLYEEWRKSFTLPEENDQHKRYELVQTAVNEAYTYYYSLMAPGDNQTDISMMNANPSGFAKSMFDLQKKASSAVFYDNAIEDKVFEETLENIDPVEFRKAINDLSVVNEAVKNMIKSCNKDSNGQICKDLDNMLPDISAKPWKVADCPEIYPKFFFDTDKEIIEKIRDYIKFVKSDSTIDSVLDECSANPQDPKYQEYKKWIDFKKSFDKWFPDNE